MTLSILIPTYDFVCYPLVLALHGQAEALGIDYEILVAEDGSKQQDRVVANLKINELPHCRHLRRTENAGRAAIRNILADEARGEWLLFLDSDAKVEKPDFLAAYLAAANAESPEPHDAQEEPDSQQEKPRDEQEKPHDTQAERATARRSNAPVIVGGLYHAAACADPTRALRFRYEHEADKSRGAAQRSLKPYMEFSMFNSMIRSDIFLALRFDEQCREYGYEDVLFGLALQRRGIPILHIDNALLHTGLDTNVQFLGKTEAALRTLAALAPELRECSRVHRLFTRLKRYALAPLLRAAFRLCGKPLRRHLEKSARPSLRLFALYKLLYYASLRPAT